MQCKKKIRVEDNKKKMNVASYINIYTNLCTYVICDEHESKEKMIQ